jgi:hypothetical protein
MMANSISFQFYTAAFDTFITTRELRMPIAARTTIQAAARTAQADARSQAPVLTAAGTVRHPRPSGQTKQGPPIPGLLRASITVGPAVTEGPGVVRVKVGPRGERAHLYAQKEEARRAYMKAGENTARAVLPAVAQTTFDRAWKE